MILSNYHVITVKYHGPTNSNGSRVSLSSPRFNSRVIIPYDYAKNTAVDIAAEYLSQNGFNIIGKGESINDTDVIISDTFKPLK
jgi:hypothetical protein